MKKLIQYSFLMFVLVTSSCSYFTEEEVPANDLIGDYIYTTEAIYFDKYGEQKSIKTGNGGLTYATVFGIVPRTGWSYNLSYTNLTQHTLSNGNQIFTFDIPSQSVSLNGEDFLVVGLTDYEVKDSDRTIIGVFDGWIDVNGTLYFSCESLNTSLFTKTKTSYSAIKR